MTEEIAKLEHKLKWQNHLSPFECELLFKEVAGLNAGIKVLQDSYACALGNIEKYLNRIESLEGRMAKLREALKAAIVRIETGHFHMMDLTGLRDALDADLKEEKC